MKTLGTILGSLLFVTACGHTPSHELVDARAAYAHAEASSAQTADPADLHVAREALDKAEAEFEDDGNSRDAKDLAYIAQRMAQRAEFLANAAVAHGEARTAAVEKDKAQQAVIDAQRDKLHSAESQMQAQQTAINQQSSDLANSKAALADQQAQTEAERQARLAAEQKAKDSMDALAKSLEVKNDARGMVITLSGGVLFKTNQAVLLTGAQVQLDKVAEALKSQAEQHFTIEGHTDNQGTDSVNADLSARRAAAVKDYLVVHGVSPNAITVVGYGATRPVADNKTTEGRAMNRRVEIVVGATDQTASR